MQFAFLLEQKDDVNAAQADGMTALHWAAHHDDVNIGQTLARGRRRCQQANRYGVTPLSLACTNGNTAIVELLLDAGADPNAARPGGETALDDRVSHWPASVRSKRCSPAVPTSTPATSTIRPR